MTTNDPPAGGNETFLLASALRPQRQKGFLQITLIETQINADRYKPSAMICGLFLRNLRETRRDKEKIKDKSKKIKDDKPDFLCPKSSADKR